jgi:Actinobacteria/chloroflexi VLRF1 release factor
VNASQPAPGGGLPVSVAPERLELWLDRFSQRHGPVTWDMTPTLAIATAADGAIAKCDVPFPPMEDGCSLVDHALRDRTVGLLLVRLGGFTTSAFERQKLVVSKCGSRPVHGRTSAGGSSQQRFARRRENQARVALDAAVAAATRVLLPALSTLDAVVVGGDRFAVDTVLRDPSLAPVRELVTAPLLDVPDPRRSILVEAGATARLVHIHVVDAPVAP